MSEALRSELPPLPAKMRHLHVRRGYPVPWFVVWLDNDVEVPDGEGEPDFRVMSQRKFEIAVAQKRCWVCGGRLGSRMSFVLGPMCAVNRTNAEPPCHLLCADWSARACPFLARPHMKRNEKPKPVEVTDPAGVAILRNPGVAGVWTTRGYRVVSDTRGGVLFKIGTPERVDWYAQGRPATRAEVLESITTGLPLLEAACGGDPTQLAELAREAKRAEALVPVA